MRGVFRGLGVVILALGVLGETWAIVGASRAGPAAELEGLIYFFVSQIALTLVFVGLFLVVGAGRASFRAWALALLLGAALGGGIGRIASDGFVSDPFSLVIIFLAGSPRSGLRLWPLVGPAVGVVVGVFLARKDLEPPLEGPAPAARGQRLLALVGFLALLLGLVGVVAEWLPGRFDLGIPQFAYLLYQGNTWLGLGAVALLGCLACGAPGGGPSSRAWPAPPSPWSWAA